MLVYSGKLFLSTVIVNEQITIIFPGPELTVGAPGIAHWQLSDSEKTYGFRQDPIDSVVISDTGERCLSFGNSNFYFQVTLSDNMKTATAVMTRMSYKSAPAVLDIRYNSPLIKGIAPRYFRGRMDWSIYAKHENFLVVIPHGSDVGSDVLAYWQWTVDDHGREKMNVHFKDAIHTREETVQGEVVTFGSDSTTYYTFKGMIAKDESYFTVNMKNPRGHEEGPFTLHSTSFDHALEFRDGSDERK